MRGFLLPTIILVVFGGLFGVTEATDAQDLDLTEVIVSLELEQVPLKTALNEIEEQTDLIFAFSYNAIDSERSVSFKAYDKSVDEILKQLFQARWISWALSGKTILLKKWAKPGHDDRDSAFDEPIEGQVTDAETGETLLGVNILVKGTTIGVSTDQDGNFELLAPSLQDTLVVSYLGYQMQEVPIGGRTEIDIQLSPGAVMGDELVVTGYGSQRRQDISGAISEVDIENIQTVSSGQVAKGLQGKVSGVTVISDGQPGSTPEIRIRGINTFGDNSPLYIVDGVPTLNINSLNPNNIESMQVLKDASASSIYGARASNGVVVISTKGGEGDIQLRYNAFGTYEVPKTGNVWNLLSPQKWAELRWTAIENSGQNPRPDPFYGNGESPRLPDFITPVGAMEGEVNLDNYYVDPLYTSVDQLNSFFRIVRANKGGTNWYDEITSPALSYNQNLSVSGGGDQGNYLVSLNHMNQGGTLMQTYNKRTSFRVNTQFNINENIRIGENAFYSISDNPQSNTLVEYSPIANSFRVNRLIPVHDIGGNYAGNHGFVGNGANPVAMLERTQNNTNGNKRLFGNVFGEIDLLNNLMLKTSFGGNIRSNHNTAFTYPEYENQENNTVNSYEENSLSEISWTWTNTAQYQEDFWGTHSIDLLLGSEIQQIKGNWMSSSIQDFYSFDPNFTSLSTGSGIKTTQSTEWERALLSFFGKLDYKYKNKYYTSLTLRRDGSSKLLDNQWDIFPALSVGWRISQEHFMQDIEWISNLMVRASYGIVGNQRNVDPANSYTLFGLSPWESFYAINGSNSETKTGFLRSRIGNPDAKWEKNTDSNIGIDAYLFEDKLEVSLDYYKKEVKDLLFAPELIGSAGNASPPSVNVGRMVNNGIDAMLRYNGQGSSLFQYSVGLTFTTYQNEIKKVANNTTFFGNDTRRWSESIVRNQVGHPVSSFYGYKIIGFWDDPQEIDEANNLSPRNNYQTDAGVGRYRYADINGDNQITVEDKTFLGDPNPDFTYGLDLNLNYRNFDISAFLYGSQGNDIWDQTKWHTDFYGTFTAAKSKEALYDSWTSNNHNASLPIQETQSNFSSAGVPNSYFVEDGSFLKLKNIIFGYTLPSDLSGKFGASNLRIYAQASNIFTITGYSGIDPEIGGGVTSFGIDEGAYVPPRQFQLGINVVF